MWTPRLSEHPSNATYHGQHNEDQNQQAQSHQPGTVPAALTPSLPVLLRIMRPNTCPFGSVNLTV